MPRCDCGAYIASGSECQTCRLEHQHGTLEDRRENCTVCGGTVAASDPITSVDGQTAHAECGGQARCDGGTETAEGLEPLFWCPWCETVVDDETGYDHAYEHQDKAPYAHLVEELLADAQEDAPNICYQCEKVIDEPDEPDVVFEGEPIHRTCIDDLDEEDWSIEQQGLDGEPAQGQTTIGGGVAKDGGESR